MSEVIRSFKLCPPGLGEREVNYHPTCIPEMAFWYQTNGTRMNTNACKKDEMTVGEDKHDGWFRVVKLLAGMRPTLKPNDKP